MRILNWDVMITIKELCKYLRFSSRFFEQLNSCDEAIEKWYNQKNGFMCWRKYLFCIFISRNPIKMRALRSRCLKSYLFHHFWELFLPLWKHKSRVFHSTLWSEIFHAFSYHFVRIEIFIPTQWDVILILYKESQSLPQPHARPGENINKVPTPL